MVNLPNCCNMTLNAINSRPLRPLLHCGVQQQTIQQGLFRRLQCTITTSTQVGERRRRINRRGSGSPSIRRPCAERNPVSETRTPPAPGNIYSERTATTQPQVDSPTIIASRCSINAVAVSSEALPERRSVSTAIGLRNGVSAGVMRSSRALCSPPLRDNWVNTTRGSGKNWRTSHMNWL